jgi:serine/threonine protein kinase
MDADTLRGVTLQDLNPLYEAFSEENDEHGNPVFLFSSFGYTTQDFFAYFGTSSLRKYGLTPSVIKESLKPLPDDDVYPKIQPGITIVSPPVNSEFFVKAPKLNASFRGTGLLPELVLKEVSVLERLKKQPHPHIVRYHGCLSAKGRIVGLVFDRCFKTLFQRLDEEDDRRFEVETCMESVTDAVHHLHTLGLAHNDLNPANIMVDEDDVTYLIDMGSCQPFGHALITAGSRGWIDEEFTTSDLKHDKVALDKLRDWLEAHYPFTAPVN